MNRLGGMCGNSLQTDSKAVPDRLKKHKPNEPCKEQRTRRKIAGNELLMWDLLARSVGAGVLEVLHISGLVQGVIAAVLPPGTEQQASSAYVRTKVDKRGHGSGAQPEVTGGTKR